MAKFFYNLGRENIVRVLAALLLILVSGVGILYWQEAMALSGLIFVILMAVLLGAVVVLGVTVAQRDGFLDGFRNGCDEVKKTEEQS